MAVVALVSPPLSFQERYGKLASAANTMPCLACLALAAVVRDEGFEARIIEASSLGLTLDEAHSRVVESGAEIVLLTATTMSIVRQAELAARIKEVSPRVLTLIGGPHFTAAPEVTMERFPHFDLGAIGEGEDTLREVLQAYKDGREFDSISGLLLRRNGSLVRTPARPLIRDLDRLPFPAWDLLPGFPYRFKPTASRVRKLPVASLVTSRGCPWQCTFCDRSVFGNKYRFYSTQYVWEMVSTLYSRYGVRELVIEDDMFFVNKKRVTELCELLMEKGLPLSWSAMGRVNNVTPELLKVMKGAGCWQINYGIESGDQRILDSVEKKIRLEIIEQALRWTKEAGIEAKGFFILGFPTETRESIEATISFAKKVELTDISVTLLTPLPGTPLYEVAHQYGHFEDNWEKMNLLTPVFVPFGFTAQELETYVRRMWREFYLRPKVIGAYLRRVASNPRLARDFFRGAAALMRMAFS